MTDDEIAGHLCVLRLAYDESSPFRGMIDFHGDGGLLTLPVKDQRAVVDKMDDDLKRQVFGDDPP